MSLLSWLLSIPTAESYTLTAVNDRRGIFGAVLHVRSRFVPCVGWGLRVALGFVADGTLLP
ncbi:MAG: hypothetical protein FWE05_13730 [Defluviitaleaceae bacterium]|nr:hypothetical protein [Defluviitaleaceae bacterium]